MRTQVLRKTVAGGIIGSLMTNPKKTLAKAIDGQAVDGWHLTAITPLSQANAFMFLLSLVVLVCTLGMWTFGEGYLLAFEKESEDANL